MARLERLAHFAITGLGLDYERWEARVHEAHWLMSRIRKVKVPVSAEEKAEERWQAQLEVAERLAKRKRKPPSAISGGPP
jgi:hypothetical protein